MYCRNCGQQIIPEAEFCTRCGAKPRAGNSFYPNCGSNTLELAQICVKCGTKLESAGTAKTAAPLPGVISAYRYGWKSLWNNFGILLVVWIIATAIGGIAGFISGFIPFFSFISLFVTIPLGYGLSYCFISAQFGRVNIDEVFSGFNHYWDTIGSSILVVLICIGGFLLLIVPGIIFACKLAFVPYLVTDRGLGPVDAIKTSWRMTNGHTLKVFLIGLLAIPIYIAGLICLVIGVVVSAMWVNTTLASLYYAVSEEQKGV